MVVACAPMKNQSSEQFYTWVDANGQIRTTQKLVSDKKKAAPKIAETKNPQPNKQAPGTAAFDNSAYRSSEELDRQLSDTKMFSWQEDGRTITQEAPVMAENKDEVSVSVITPQLTFEVSDYSTLMDQVLFSGDALKGREMDLFRAYTYSQDLKVDSILIELDWDQVVSTLTFSSYIRHAKMALPRVVFLSERYTSITSPAVPFTHFVSESWSSYGYLQGALEVPRSARYMLILPNTEAGAIELEGDKIQLSDEGRIMFKPYQPPNGKI